MSINQVVFFQGITLPRPEPMQNNLVITPALKVLARWAWGEIDPGNRSSQSYDGVPGIEALRSKKAQGADLEQLSVPEITALADGCVAARNVLMTFLNGVQAFETCVLTKHELGAVVVPPNVWGSQSEGHFVPFWYYEATAPNHPTDARVAVAAPNAYRAPKDNLTLAWVNGYPLLMDGYHRAVSFYRFAPRRSTIMAYRPYPAPEAT